MKSVRVRHRAQGGFSLLEALVSVMFTSIVILALAASLLAAIRSSAVSERVQRSDSALGSFTESLKTMPYPTPTPPDVCPTAQDYRDAWASFGNAWQPPAADIDIEIVSIEHWQPTGTDMGKYTSSCPTTGDPSSHRLTVSVEIDGKTRNAQVVVSER